jgi:membrane-associated phospholipid phosphatase
MTRVQWRSGHATSAFAAASVLERHFEYRGSWPALLAASYVAASRLVDNRHFLSDVIFGAALGEAVGWTIVGRRQTKDCAATGSRSRWHDGGLRPDRGLTSTR